MQLSQSLQFDLHTNDRMISTTLSLSFNLTYKTQCVISEKLPIIGLFPIANILLQQILLKGNKIGRNFQKLITYIVIPINLWEFTMTYIVL